MAEMAHRVHCSRHVMQMPSYKSNKATPIPLSSAQCSSIHTAAAAAAAGLLYNGCTLLKELNGRPSILQQYNHVRRDPARPTGWLGLLAAVASPLAHSIDGRQSQQQPVRVHYAIKNFGHDVVCIYTPRESLENVSSCFPTRRREREPAAVHITDSV